MSKTAAECEALVVHALFRLLADFGNTIEKKIPGSDLHMGRVMLWCAVGRIAGEHGQDAAVAALKDIIQQIEDGALEGETGPSNTPPVH